MAESARFASYSDNQLSDILENRDSSENTKQVVKAAASIVQQYCKEKGKDFEVIRELEFSELDQFLQHFYAEVRKQNGEPYSRSSFFSLRFGLQRLFRTRRKIDIINAEEFTASKEIFLAVVANLKRCGKAETKHKEAITESDLKKLYNSDTFSLHKPWTLQNKVFFDVMLFICPRGRENLRRMDKNDIELREDEEGKRYYVCKTIQQKQAAPSSSPASEADDYDDDEMVNNARAYENPVAEVCPVVAMEKYLSKLHPDSPYLWQRPKRALKSRNDPVWYDSFPLGHNTLGRMMGRISTEADLSQQYTNCCIRTTRVSLLDSSGK